MVASDSIKKYLSWRKDGVSRPDAGSGVVIGSAELRGGVEWEAK
jgi:hypothetical protein